MDKTAKRLKQKRRTEKAHQRREYEAELVEKFRQRCIESNVKISKKNSEIVKAYKETETDCLKKAMLINSVCTLYALRKLYGYGKTRLYRMAVELTVRIGNVGQAERRISQMSEDLRLDAGLDCDRAWRSYTPPESKSKPYELKAVYESIPRTLPIALYAVHISLGFKARRMNKVYDLVCNLIKRSLATGTIKPMLDELASIGLTVNERGQYIAGGKRIAAEHEKFMKRTGGYKNAKNGISNFKRAN